MLRQIDLLESDHDPEPGKLVLYSLGDVRVLLAARELERNGRQPLAIRISRLCKERAGLLLVVFVSLDSREAWSAGGDRSVDPGSATPLKHVAHDPVAIDSVV